MHVIIHWLVRASFDYSKCMNDGSCLSYDSFFHHSVFRILHKLFSIANPRTACSFSPTLTNEKVHMDYLRLGKEAGLLARYSGRCKLRSIAITVWHREREWCTRMRYLSDQGTNWILLSVATLVSHLHHDCSVIPPHFTVEHNTFARPTPVQRSVIHSWRKWTINEENRTYDSRRDMQREDSDCSSPVSEVHLQWMYFTGFPAQAIPSNFLSFGIDVTGDCNCSFASNLNHLTAAPPLLIVCNSVILHRCARISLGFMSTLAKTSFLTWKHTSSRFRGGLC